ncbi:MAG: RdgB/HAM1 family non-canonical purine NTP pyrophosphatase [Clostridiales bacterium]|nr:RdgB/HAM1 family non-canonical purine NTP pyrophosphatase [Clostridiales bacterium]MDD6390402.1 RdgB/HAM1 family non-canonical purine NTP pyrophosphatase [Bacillota bacterium]
MDTIVAATRNRHKIEEIEKILKEFDMSIVSRDDAGVPDVEIVEDGETFEENSYKKAYEIMKLSGRPSVADDSGLCVDYLGGAPGVMSARFTPSGDDEENNRKVLELLEGVPFGDRTARYVAVITLVYPDGRTVSARGECEGHIIEEERGTNGFGYDPMFQPAGYDRTFGELSPEIKNRISHRAKALVKLREKLLEDDK